MVKVICGWCKEEFDAMVYRGKDGTGDRNPLFCPNCGNTVNSSIKEPTGEVVGRKHIHRELRKGNVV